MFLINRFIRGLFKFAVAITSILLSLGAFASLQPDILDETHAAVQAVMAVQEEVTPSLMEQPEILGTAVGLDNIAGTPVLTIYVDRDATNVSEVIRNLPPEIRGVRASGGWAYDLAHGYCCTGTLGSLVRIGSAQYVLSACHVLEGDIVLGGNNRIAQTGDPVIQPGLVDENCNRFLAQTVGTLVKRSSLTHSNVDCAIARVVAGMVRTNGAILGIGTISHYISAASLNQHVKKSGRTTGLTHSWISGLNATVRVTFTNECHGGTYYKTFSGQIVVNNQSMAFLKAGDSGSLLVQDISTNPRAISLLIASNSTVAFANPIGQVLSFLGATMVGN